MITANIGDISCRRLQDHVLVELHDHPTLRLKRGRAEIGEDRRRRECGSVSA